MRALGIAILALGLRCLDFPEREEAAPWIESALAVQGLALEEGAAQRADLTVAVPIAAAQNVDWAIGAISGRARDGSRAAWIREREAVGRGMAWALWAGAAACAAGWVSLRYRGWVGLLGGVGMAVLPVSIAGVTRLEGWGLAAPLLVLAWTADRGVRSFPCWAAVFSLSPLGWIAALPALLFGDGRRRTAVLLGAALGWALVPQRLTDPLDAMSAIPSGLLASGWPGLRHGPPGRLLLASWTPGPIVAAFGLLPAIVPSCRKETRGWILTALVLWWVPALLGARVPDGVGLVAPLAALLAAIGAAASINWAKRGRSGVAGLVVAAFLAFPVVGTVSMVRADRGKEARGEALARLLAVEVGKAGILASAAGALALPDSIHAFVFPTHRERPEAYDFAYWPGWYGRFTHMLFQARTLQRLEGEGGRPGARSLLGALRSHATPVGAVGEPATEPGAWVLFRLTPGAPWEPSRRAELMRDLKGGPIEAGFARSLGAFLADRGEVERATEMLRLSLRWSPEEPETWRVLGAVLLQRGDPKGAAEVLSEALRRDPRSSEARLLFGRAYRLGGIPGRAVLELNHLVAEHPTYAAAHLELARAAAEDRQWALAARALEAYLALEPHAPDRARLLETLEQARRLAQEPPS
jgi:tetratricopeptide (TPR) repeat protein